MKIKIALFSDTHTFHHRVILPECDIALFAGDSTDRGEQHLSLNFFNWYNLQTQATHKLFIAGNHENNWDPEKRFNKDKPEWLSKEFLTGNYPNIKYLDNESVNILGLNIYGTPYTPDFFPEYWGFNKPRGLEIRKEWDKIPDNTDILISHGPMKGYMDYIKPSGMYSPYPEGNVGCLDLKDRVYQLQNLKLMVCGHIHEGNGICDIPIGDRNLIYVNAACCDGQNYFRNQPYVVEIEI